MKYAKTVCALLLVIGISIPYAQSVGQTAPDFSIYQYKDKTFDTDSIYKKKVLCIIFGSIT